MFGLPFFLFVVVVIVGATVGELNDSWEYTSSPENRKPNIILIITDDQDVTLQGLIPMTATQDLLGLKGVTFSNAFTSSPICCPSRASILSGLYAHNHATINNSQSGGCYGNFWKEKIEPNALPVVLQSHGYETFFAGKYLNEYFSKKVPPGWNHFYGLHGNSRYYNYTLTENGNIVSYEDEYLTDVVSQKVATFISTRSMDSPFFAMMTPPAPHSPYTPADRHTDSFEDVKALRTPNFNMISGPLDKHWLVEMGKKLPDSVIDKIDIYFRKRWQSLLAVDEMVLNIIHHLHEAEELNNTYIVYTSDNGYHIGQFAQPFDKRQPYETDIRVPFLVRGPNIPEKIISNTPIALIDLYPTILEWAEINRPEYLDGISFNSYLNDTNNDYNPIADKHYHRQILIEYWGEGNENTYNPECPWQKSDRLTQCTLDADCHCQDSWNNTYACIRHFAYNTNKIYCEFHDEEHFVEAYDLQVDLYQITNLGYELLPSERAMYSIALQNLTKCIGESCRNTKF